MNIAKELINSANVSLLGASLFKTNANIVLYPELITKAVASWLDYCLLLDGIPIDVSSSLSFQSSSDSCVFTDYQCSESVFDIAALVMSRGTMTTVKAHELLRWLLNFTDAIESTNYNNSLIILDFYARIQQVLSEDLKPTSKLPRYLVTGEDQFVKSYNILNSSVLFSPNWEEALPIYSSDESPLIYNRVCEINLKECNVYSYHTLEPIINQQSLSLVCQL